MSAQKVLVTPTFTAKPLYGGTVALIPGDTQYYHPDDHTERHSRDYLYRFNPADGWRFPHLEVSYDISTTDWEDGVVVDDVTETFSNSYYPDRNPYFDFDSDGQYADTAAHYGEAFSSMKPYWFEMVIVNPGSTPERFVRIQQRSRIVVEAVFRRIPTNLLVNSFNREPRVRLVYDPDTNLLVGDY